MSSDVFDTPPIIPTTRPPSLTTKTIRPRVAERLATAGDTLGRGLDAAGKTVEKPSTRWISAAERRAAARTPEARDALYEANRAHRDAMRDVRRDRRAYEKARSEVSWWNVFNGERRAAASVVRDSRALARESRAARRAAREAYPLSMAQLAVRCHALHCGVTAAWCAVSDSFLSDVAPWLSATGVAANATVVWLGRRNAPGPSQDDALEALRPSQHERDLLQRLDPAEWPRYAGPRKLTDVLVSGAKLTESGIQVKLTFQDVMDLTKLRAAMPQLRAALRLEEDVRLELREGKTGGHGRMTLRTRSTADGLNLTGWYPGASWAVNTVTGEEVPVPLGRRVLFAGASGSGKSWSARPLMAEASEYTDHRLVIFDRKHIEALNWNHRARVVTELDEMREVCDELVAEGEARLKLIPRGSDVIAISDTRPRITVFVDEGGELISDSKTKYPKDEDGRSDYSDIMDRMRTIARKYRAAEIILVWCTQKPSLSGDGHGLDSQIAGQIVHRLALTLASATDSQVVFGSDAIEKGWKGHELPMVGYAYFRNQELGPRAVPEILKMRAMSAQAVIALPARPVWRRETGRATAGDVAERKALETAGAQSLAAGDPWAKVTTSGTAALAAGTGVTKPRISAEDRDDQILSALRADPCQRLSELARLTGASKSVVKRRLEQMAVDGLVTVDEDGCWHPVG